jgi:hypothetical protein
MNIPKHMARKAISRRGGIASNRPALAGAGRLLIDGDEMASSVIATTAAV